MPKYIQFYYLIFVFFAFNYDANAQPGPIKMFRYSDDFSYLLQNDSIDKSWNEHLKFMPLNKTGNINLSLGGEVREQYQYFRNENFGDLPPNTEQDNNGHLWHRIMLHADLRLGSQVRIFTQLNSTYAFGKENILPQIDENQLSLHQAFIRLESKKIKGLFSQIGRQEFGQGSEFLIAMREGPNTRLTFDAVLVGLERKKNRLYSFIATPVISETGVFDDSRIDEYIWTLYNVHSFEKTGFDIYYVGFYSEENAYNFNQATERRQTLGTRIYNLPNKPFQYNVQAMYQFGSFGDASISAYHLMGIFGYKLKSGKYSLIPGLTFNYASGDKSANDNRLNTFNMLYSRPTFGLAAPIGATNIINIKPSLEFNPKPNIRLILSNYFMWRQSTNDGTYTPRRAQIRPQPFQLFNSDENEIGQQLSLELWYLMNVNWSFFIDAAYFVPGEYIKATGQGQPITYLSGKISYKF